MASRLIYQQRTMEQALKIRMESKAQPAEASLLGDFDDLVLTSQQRIFRILLGMVRDSELAENLTQESFIKAYENRHTFRGESTVTTWLTRIAINVARDHRRNQRARFWSSLFGKPEAFDSAVALTPDRRSSQEQGMLAKESVSKVWEAAQELSHQQRAVFILRFAEEMTLEEIAEATGLKVGTVKMHLFRAVHMVRARVKNESEVTP
ncbi:MAG TPA: sigma-70 family RNA polymerase sigma factor [Terriglobales bacterium]|nr:sigma-70 family RNA polymerase sigma factor [Terriglobales bacterium]